jgi:hypothetical protein
MAIATNFPSIKPSLLLDFANTKALDPRITFTRATTATFYDGVTTAKAEENLFTRSQEFDTTDWTKTGCSVTANTSSAPDGTTTADTLTASASTSVHNIQQPTTVSGAPIVISIFAKAGTHSFLQIFQGNASINYANFNLSTGALGTVGAAGTASITDAGNGWYRCSFVFTPLAISAVRFALISSATAAYNESWTTAGTETVLLWGAQIEVRSSVTAYTATTTQAITNYIPQLMTAASGVARFDHNPITDESLGLLIEEQRTNLVLRSEEFDNAVWVKNACTVSANTLTAPDGAITADKLVEDTSTGLHFLHYLATFAASTSYTVSVYAKAGERTRFQIGGSGSAWASFSTAVFDLSAGTVVTNTGAFTSASITPAGNGWYRCTATGLSNASPVNQQVAQFFLVQSGTTTSYTGNGFSGLFIWGAQLEAGAFATSYIPTVAASVTRNADAASMTGTNFSSWYSAPEGTVYTEFQLTSGNGAGNNANIVALEGAGGLNMTVHRDSAAGWRYRTNLANLNISGVSDTLSNKIVFAYATSSYPFVASGGAVQLNTGVGVAPVTTSLVIGGGSNYALSRAINGTIRKIAYYPIRVTNANLQALTS